MIGSTGRLLVLLWGCCSMVTGGVEIETKRCDIEALALACCSRQ